MKENNARSSDEKQIEINFFESLDPKLIHEVVDQIHEKKIKYHFLSNYQNRLDHYDNNKESSLVLQYFITNLLQYRLFLRVSDLFKIKQIGDLSGLNLEQQMIAKKEVILKSQEQIVESLLAMQNKEGIIQMIPFFSFESPVSLFNEEKESCRILFDILIFLNPITYLNETIHSSVRDIMYKMNVSISDVIASYLFQVFDKENLFFIAQDLFNYEFFERQFPNTNQTYLDIFSLFKLDSQYNFDTDIYSVVELNPFILKQKVTSFEEAKLFLNTDCMKRIDTIAKERKISLSYKNLELLYLSPSYHTRQHSLFDLISQKIFNMEQYIKKQPREIIQSLNVYIEEYLDSSLEDLYSEMKLLATNPEKAVLSLNNLIDRTKLSIIFIEQKNNEDIGFGRLVTNLQKYIQKCDFSIFEEKIIHLSDEDKITYFEILMQCLEVPEHELPTFCPESKLYIIVDQIIERVKSDKKRQLSPEYISNVYKLLNLYITKFSYLIKMGKNEENIIVPFKKIKNFIVNCLLNEKNSEFNDYLTFPGHWKVKKMNTYLEDINKKNEQANQFYQNYGFQYIGKSQDKYLDKNTIYQANLEFKELYQTFKKKHDLGLKNIEIIEKEIIFEQQYGMQAYLNILKQSFIKNSVLENILMFIPSIFISLLPKFFNLTFNPVKLRKKKQLQQELERKRRTFDQNYEMLRNNELKRVQKDLIPDYTSYINQNAQKNKDFLFNSGQDENQPVLSQKMAAINQEKQRGLKAKAFNLELPERSAEKKFLLHIKSILKKIPGASYLIFEEGKAARIIVDVLDENKSLIATSVYAFSILSFNKSIDEVIINLCTNGILNIDGHRIISLTGSGIERVKQLKA